MKTLLILASFWVGSSAFADGISESMQDVALARIQRFAASADNALNWKVGDTATFKIALGSNSSYGNEYESVTKFDGATLWLNTTIRCAGFNQVDDVQLDRKTGATLRHLINGQEKPISTTPWQTVSRDAATITVPAGTFNTVHVVMKSDQVSKFEVWTNPTATVMEGTIQEVLTTNAGDMTFQLQSFTRGH